MRWELRCEIHGGDAITSPESDQCVLNTGTRRDRTSGDRLPVPLAGTALTPRRHGSSSKLSAVIDFGTCGIGDPAGDLVMAWTYFAGDDRRTFRQAGGLPEGTWPRARGWAMWAGLFSPGPEGFQSRGLADPVVG
ncbi:phosphotransferase [Nonomuraea sp. NPDC003754]